MSSLDDLRDGGDYLAKLRDLEQGQSATTATLARRARREGHSISEIARAAGVSRPTIYQWLREGDSK